MSNVAHLPTRSADFPIVEFTRADVLAVAQYGLDRTLNAIADERKLEPGRDDLGFGRSIEGVFGEMALAVHLGVPYRPETKRPDTSRGDVAGCQVRATARRNGCLIVRKNDPAGFPYVLALLAPWKAGVAVGLVGWIMGRDAKQDRHWRERGSVPGIHRSAFFVPQGALHGIETLPGATVPRAA